MREILIGEAELTTLVGRPMTCVYHMLIRSVPPPVCCESYGIGVVISQTGEREDVLDITVCPERIEELARLVVRGKVTPCTLREVIEDWL